jgi:hypothetical protein
MPTSGSKDFSVTRSEIIRAALRKCGVYDQGEAVPASEEQDAAFALNVLVKEWSARGIDIWLRKELTVFITGNNKKVYSIGPTGDHATTDTPVVSTLSADAAALATTLSITDTTGMSDGDFIGIKLDDNELFFTTLTTVATGTIAVGLPSAASSGSAVYTYTTKANRPTNMIYVMRRNNNEIDVPVELIGENRYQSLSLKEQEGPTTQVWYKPTLDNGSLSIWPTGGNNGGYDRLIFQARFHPDDFDAVSDEPEFPIEWSNALIFHLAHDLAPEYGVDRQTRADLYRIAERKLEEQLEHDVENASVVLGLDQRSQVAQ